MEFIGLGCIARDWMGNFLGAKYTFQQTMVEPKMAEAISTIHVFEGDSLQLIQNINLASPLLNSTGHYVDSIKHMQMVFNSSRIAHCKREANGVAHLLAKEAAIQFVDCTWTETPPMICNLLCRERFSPWIFFVRSSFSINERNGSICSKKKNYDRLSFMSLKIKICSVYIF